MYVFRLAAKSVFEFIILVLSDSLHLENKRVNKTYMIYDYGNYTVFRDTINNKKYSEKPVTLVVGFRLKLIKSNNLLHWIFQRICILTTPFWSGFRGFHIKLWMVDKKTKNYLGIYEWYGENNADLYASTLEKVLVPLSTPRSVWHKIITTQSFNKFLETRQTKNN